MTTHPCDALEALRPSIIGAEAGKTRPRYNEVVKAVVAGDHSLRIMFDACQSGVPSDFHMRLVELAPVFVGGADGGARWQVSREVIVPTPQVLTSRRGASTLLEDA